MTATPDGGTPRKTAAWQKAIPWLITVVCFTYLYTRLSAAATREGMDVAAYLIGTFQKVDWLAWLALMVPYSAFFFLIDSLIVWRVVNWFNAPVRYTDILPIRASSYILSIINEQVGKGAMVLYLNRRDGVPGWQVGSSMLFIMFCEFYYLLSWATVGVSLRWDSFPEVFHVIPWLLGVALCFFAGWVAFFKARPAASGSAEAGAEPSRGFRDREILTSFRRARAWQYATVILLRSPALLAAVVVYTWALRLFGVEATYLDMLGYLPVIFFGAATPGPMRSAAIVLWVTLFPEHEGEMAAFGFVQHNFFIFFNAAIGLLFLRRANRELFGDEARAKA